MKHLLVAVALLLALPSLAQDAPRCKLVRLANWHVRFFGTHPVIDGSINGKKIGVLIDTGAFASIITKSAADRLELQTHATGRTIVGVGSGESRVFEASIDELHIGDFSAKGLRHVRVAGENPIPGRDFILGQDVLAQVDIEFDYANGMVRLYQPLDCKGRSLAYWDPNAQELPLSGNYHDIIPVVVNGRKADAMIDSGGGHSLVQLAFAEQVGVTPTSRGVRSASCTFGVGAGTVRQWYGLFDSIQIGGEAIRNAHVLFGELASDTMYYRASGPDMMLGGDFLKAHHVLISHSQGKFYFSYTGGQVFPATPGLECNDERVAGKNAKEALAIYDDILAKDPRDVNTLLQRGNLRFAQRDLSGALSDFDAVIRLDPANAVAFWLRSYVRAALKDYDGALADSDTAIANGMRTADAYMWRAGIRRAAGDRAGMMAEFDEALNLDPHHVGVLRSRARAQYFDGKYAEADHDLSAALAVRSNAFDSIWLYFTRAREGDDKPEPLETGMAQLKKDEWPMPVMQHLLGHIDRDSLMKAAAADEKERKGRVCEANFYSGERLLISGKKDEARPLLEAARDSCPTGYIEYDAAIVELQRLK
jgi:lipoprotein NlpI/predicted aspartyl protease